MSQPNFIVILTDDQGYGDAGCYGADDLQTPNLDRLAAGGCRFTQWYGGAPVCSASRAALMTGQFPWEVGVPSNVAADLDVPRGLDLTTPALPELLREAGYATRMSGKWHLGQCEPERPHNRGFENWFGFLYGCVDFYSHIFYWLMSDGKRPPRHDLYLDGEEIYRNGEYLTDLIADHAIEYLKEMAASGQPFFLYVPFNSPHYPMHAPPEAVERFADLPEDRKWTAAMLYTYDQALGRILDAVEELGLAENTAVLASTDHGPSREPRNWPDGRTDEVYRGGSTGGLRGAKFSLFEGGIRLPALLRWPGVTTPGSTCDALTGHIDLLPTFMKAATGEGATPSKDGRPLRGGDLLPVLKGEADAVQRDGDMVWHHGDQWAVRRGNFKLVQDGIDPDPADGSGEAGLRLYDLGEDPGERSCVAARHADVVDELKQQIGVGE